ncbi:Kelch repeat-containing protein [Spirosoma areae]
MKLSVRFTEKLRPTLIRSGCLVGLLLLFIGVFSKANAQIYVKQGVTGTRGFYRYDIPTNKWASLSNIPFLFDGSKPLFTDSTYIYTSGITEPKRGSVQLFRYDFAKQHTGNGWQALPDKRPIVGTGPIFNATGINFYYFLSEFCTPPDSLNPGCLQYAFYRRNLQSDSITRLSTVAQVYALVAAGSSLYGIQGNSFALWDESSMSFLPKATPPGNLRSLSATTKDYIYVLGTSDQLYRYTIATDTWTTLPGTSPVEAPFDIWSITTDGNKIYATAGGDTFYGYNLGTSTWETLPPPPNKLWDREGANLIYMHGQCLTGRCISVAVTRIR